MSEEPWQKVRRLLRAVLKDCEHQLQDKDLITISELIDVGEWDLAFDTLCTQLYEYGERVPDRVMRDLVEVGHLVRADPELWEDLATDPQA
jgi:hypothetical protein